MPRSPAKRYAVRPVQATSSTCPAVRNDPNSASPAVAPRNSIPVRVGTTYVPPAAPTDTGTAGPYRADTEDGVRRVAMISLAARAPWSGAARRQPTRMTRTGMGDGRGDGVIWLDATTPRRTASRGVVSACRVNLRHGIDCPRNVPPPADPDSLLRPLRGTGQQGSRGGPSAQGNGGALRKRR